MLNHTLHSQLGFGNAVRASAGLISGLLIISCLLMRTRLPPSKQSLNLLQTLRKCGRDKAYLIGTFGSDQSSCQWLDTHLLLLRLRLAIFTTGYYYPLFYLQLNAIQHGIDPSLAFNAVRRRAHSSQLTIAERILLSSLSS